MAGSLADFKYTDNKGNSWLLRLDKSNCLTTGTGFTAITSSDLGLPYLPRNIEARYVIAHHPTRPIKRDIICQSVTAPLWTGSQSTIQLRDYQDGSMQTFTIGERKSERAKYTAKLIDTYQNDSP